MSSIHNKWQQNSILLDFYCFPHLTDIRNPSVIMCVTHSSCWATGVCGIVRAACVVGGLTHGALRPFLLLIHRHFGDRSEQKTQSKSWAYRQNPQSGIWPANLGVMTLKRRRIRGSRLYCPFPAHSSEVQLSILCNNEISTWAYESSQLLPPCHRRYIPVL